MAALNRKTAEEAGVPILQNVQLARGLNEKVELDNYIGSEFFDEVAEVLHWADGMRRETGGGGDTPSGGSSPPHATYALKAFCSQSTNHGPTPRRSGRHWGGQEGGRTGKGRGAAR